MIVIGGIIICYFIMKWVIQVLRTPMLPQDEPCKQHVWEYEECGFLRCQRCQRWPGVK